MEELDYSAEDKATGGGRSHKGALLAAGLTFAVALMVTPSCSYATTEADPNHLGTIVDCDSASSECYGYFTYTYPTADGKKASIICNSEHPLNPNPNQKVTPYQLYQTYQIKRGDTLSDIVVGNVEMAYGYGIAPVPDVQARVGAVAVLNNISNPNIIHTGDILKLPYFCYPPETLH